MEFGGAQGDVFKLPLQAGISGERAGPLGSVREGRGVRGGERGGGGKKEQRDGNGEKGGRGEREQKYKCSKLAETYSELYQSNMQERIAHAVEPSILYKDTPEMTTSPLHHA